MSQIGLSKKHWQCVCSFTPAEIQKLASLYPHPKQVVEVQSIKPKTKQNKIFKRCVVVASSTPYYLS